MADRKISDLTALTTPAAGDYLPIVDISEPSNASKNKRITIEELLRGAPDGTAAAPSIAFESDPDSGLYSAGANALGLVTNGTARLYINSSGQVGIGTAAPSSLLHVEGGTAYVNSTNAGGTSTPLQLSNAGASGTCVVKLAFNSAASTKASINAAVLGNDYLTFNTGSDTERMRIDSSGRLLVGTSSDSGGALLQVNDNRIRIATAKTPSSASDTGTAGEICWDANYIYVCTATNTWKRTAISTW